MVRSGKLQEAEEKEQNSHLLEVQDSEVRKGVRDFGGARSVDGLVDP